MNRKGIRLNQTIERTALTNLLSNEDYARIVLPFIKEDYFDVREERIIFEEINKFTEKYNKIPTQVSLEIEVGERKDLNETEHNKIVEIIKTLNPVEVDFDWLVDTTEKFCKDKAIYNAIVEGISIIDGKDKKRTVDSLPSILTDALAVSFDDAIGHDYLVDYDERYQYYHKVEERIPFDLDFFNRITKGGLPPKTLNIALAGTGVGKSLFMCHMAANCLSQGKNVLYISLEMAEERIAERIDANMMNISIPDLHDLPKKMFDDKITRLQKKAKGKLIIKEYRKENQKKTIKYIDYLINESRPKKDGIKLSSFLFSFVFSFNSITLFLAESELLITNSKLLNILIFLDAWNNPLHKEIKDKKVIPIILKRFRN